MDQTGAMLMALSAVPKGIQPSILSLLGFWAGAFVSLCLAVVVLVIFSEFIGSDTEFMSLGKELVLAGVVSALVGGSAFALTAWVPAASGRGMFLPLIALVVIYQVAHYDKWGRYEAALLLILQLVFMFAGMALVLGQFQLAFVLVAATAVFLGIFASLARSL